MAGGHKTREQEPVSITKADIQQQVSGTKSRTAPGPDVSPVCSLKKLTALLDHLTGQTGGLIVKDLHKGTHVLLQEHQDRWDKEQEEELSWMTEPLDHTGLAPHMHH